MIARAGVITNFKEAEKQIMFWRDHLDIAIEQIFAPIKLTRDQHVIARAFGRGTDVKIVQSRGSGKTWLVALCCAAMCVLYPGTICAVCSGTAAQATLVLQKLKLIADQNPNLANELFASSARSLVQISKDKGKCTFKNGSYMESFSIESMRGQRAKILVLDETALIPQEEQDSVIAPVKNYRRDISFNYNFEDYGPKTVCTTSACPKSNTFYDDFMRVLRDMAKGNEHAFACALDYRAAAANGITDMDYFMAEKEKMPDLAFQVEYGSKFIGANENSALPFDLTSPCRTLEKVEIFQPKNSKARYVIGMDIATSKAKGSDNTVMVVEKFVERSNGSYAKKVVFIKSYNGEPLDFLANELRKLYHLRFPGVEKIIYDARSVGDAFNRFLDDDWIDPTTGKEYPPLVVDDQPLSNPDAVQILHPFRAVNSSGDPNRPTNQRIYNNLRVALEKKDIEFPIQRRLMQAKQAEVENEALRITEEEMAIFLEADALQMEMGNIIEKKGAGSNKIYDVPKAGQHKDRYSALAMCNDFVCELEKENMKKYHMGEPVIGITSGFGKWDNSRQRLRWI